jgi:glycosyltransferase involved in cell wall biosynthesis
MIVVGHDSLAKAVDHYYHVERDVTKVIPLPVDIDVNGPEEPHPTLKGEKFLLYPAQFWPHKNHITLVNMVDELHNRGLDSKLVFCGSDKGNWNYVQQYIIDKKVPGISYIGFVTPEKLRWLYKHAYACVFSSLMGPDNLPPLEAAAYGCPVVCANYPGDHRGQLVFEPLDAAEAADKVIALEEYKPIPRPTFTGDDYVIAINRMLSEFEYTRRLWGQGYKHT